jgi:hypothetical protein
MHREEHLVGGAAPRRPAPSYLEFFGFASTRPDVLRSVARLGD